MYVCMCVCMHACMYVCMYVCIYVCNVCMYVCLFTLFSLSLSLCPSRSLVLMLIPTHSSMIPIITLFFILSFFSPYSLTPLSVSVSVSLCLSLCFYLHAHTQTQHSHTCTHLCLLYLPALSPSSLPLYLFAPLKASLHCLTVLLYFAPLLMFLSPALSGSFFLLLYLLLPHAMSISKQNLIASVASTLQWRILLFSFHFK